MNHPASTARRRCRISKYAGALMVAATVAATTVTVLPAAGAAVAQSKRCGRIAWSGYDGTSLQIWTATAGGTNRRLISNVGSGAPTANDIAKWSPDGTKLAWQGSDGTTNQIWVADADGSNRTAISSVAGALTLNSGPAWSPDGTRIAWSGKVGSLQAIFTADIDGNNRVNVSTPSRFVAGDEPVDNRFPAWSPDGTRIAWSGKVIPSFGLPLTDIYVAGTTGLDRINLSSPRGFIGRIDNFGPKWSPDSTEIAWSSKFQFTGAREIVTTRSDGLIPTTGVLGDGVSPAPAGNLSPDWSPDGSRIAWSGMAQTGPAAGTFEIFTANADITGSDRTEFAVNGAASGDPLINRSPVWSPDGLALAWSGTATGNLLDSNIYLAGADTSDRLEISTAGTGTDPTTNIHPAWAPDLGDPFTDVSGSFARADMSCIFALGVTTGTGDGTTYSPANTVTREEMAAFLRRLYEKLDGVCPGGASGFTDISGSFASADINCISAVGITSGTGDGSTYSPAQAVTREQMAAFLANLWQLGLGRTCPPGTNPLTDISGSFAQSQINCVYQLNVTRGTGDGTTYSPAQAVTREQMAAFLARFWAKAIGLNL